MPPKTIRWTAPGSTRSTMLRVIGSSNRGVRGTINGVPASQYVARNGSADVNRSAVSERLNDSSTSSNSHLDIANFGEGSSASSHSVLADPMAEIEDDTDDDVDLADYDEVTALSHTLQQEANQARGNAEQDKIFKNYCDYVKDKKSMAYNPLSRTEETPQLIVNFLMMHCENKNTTVNGKLVGCKGLSVGSGRKIRAAISRKFSRHFKTRENFYVMESKMVEREEVTVWKGNPALAYDVYEYMRSLKKRKTREGEVQKSVKAITVEILRKLHQTLVVNPVSGNVEQGARDYLTYLLAFLCLLRADEVLNITLDNIIPGDDWSMSFSLQLNWRKTQQGAEVKPFVLWRNDRDEFLCPVQSLMRWLRVLHIAGMSGETYFGPIFVDVQNGGMINFSKRLTAEKFRTSLHRNLILAGVLNEDQYGTHSFRRGGCQYFHCFMEPKEARWDLKKLCDWGGWSLEYDNLTIVKYLTSFLDKQACPRSEFLPYLEPLEAASLCPRCKAPCSRCN